MRLFTTLALLLVAAWSAHIKDATAEQLQQQVKRWLHDFDENKDGLLSVDELARTLTGTNERAGLDKERARVDADQWMQIVDADKDGAANDEELLTLLRHMQQMAGGGYGAAGAAASTQSTQKDET